MKVKFLDAFQENPVLIFTDFSSFKSGIPAAFVMASPLRASLDSTKSPPRNEEIVLLKLICCSEGALKPVLIDPRQLKVGVILYRVANFPVKIDPKSE